MKRALLVLLMLGLFVSPFVMAQSIKIEEYKVDGNMKVTVDSVGNAHVTELWKFTPNLYLQLKQEYPTTYMLKREFENKRSDVEYRNMKVEWDDSNNQLKASYTLLGAAVNKGSHWELNLGGDDVTLSSRNGNTLVLTSVQPIFGGQGRVVETATVLLPKGAESIKVDGSVIQYELPYKEGGSNKIFIILAVVSGIGLVLLNVPLKGGNP